MTYNSLEANCLVNHVEVSSRLRRQQDKVAGPEISAYPTRISGSRVGKEKADVSLQTRAMHSCIRL